MRTRTAHQSQCLAHRCQGGWRLSRRALTLHPQHPARADARTLDGTSHGSSALQRSPGGTLPTESEFPPAGLLGGVLEVVSRDPFPSLILEVASQRIVAASSAARDLLSPQDRELVGRDVKSLFADPSVRAFELFHQGRLVGFQSNIMEGAPSSMIAAGLLIAL